MRRALFDTVSVVIGSGKVVDREGFLSAVYAASIGSITGSPTAAKLTVKVEHCDTKDGTFEVVGFQAGSRHYNQRWHPEGDFRDIRRRDQDESGPFRLQALCQDHTNNQLYRRNKPGGIRSSVCACPG